jgi:uncharacterized protein YjbJ (UPF0337 family)
MEGHFCMDKDRVKGKMEDAAGRIKRQVGEWTGDKDMQAEGAMDQAKGKTQNMIGKVKDAARDIKDDLTNKHNPDERDVDKEVDGEDVA